MVSVCWSDDGEVSAVQRRVLGESQASAMATTLASADSANDHAKTE
jgi:hypothetical protein